MSCRLCRVMQRNGGTALFTTLAGPAKSSIPCFRPFRSVASRTHLGSHNSSHHSVCLQLSYRHASGSAETPASQIANDQSETKEETTKTDTTSADSSGRRARSAGRVMERAAAARREIMELWTRVKQWEEEDGAVSFGGTAAASSAEEDERDARRRDHNEERLKAVNNILERYQLDGTSTPLEEDVGRGLGDALDRLILLCLPAATVAVPAGRPPTEEEEGGLAKAGTEESGSRSAGREGTATLERVLFLASRHGRRLTVRLVQHLFARTGSYSEALWVFHALRCAHVAMNMETYHAMLYSLQRLEEEGWAQQFHDECLENMKKADEAEAGKQSGEQQPPRVSGSAGGVSEQAMEFILRGVQNPLMPENKPWLGRVMYGNGTGNTSELNESGPESFSTVASTMKQTAKSWDELGSQWLDRYRRRE